MSIIRSGKRRFASALAIATVAVLASAAASSANNGKQHEAHFQMFANPAQARLPERERQPLPATDRRRHRRARRGQRHGHVAAAQLQARPAVRPVHGRRTATRTPTARPVAGFGNFGLAWYQSDIHVNHAGTGDGQDQDDPARPDLRLRPGREPGADEHVPPRLLVQRPGRRRGRAASPARRRSTASTTPGRWRSSPGPTPTTNLGPLCTDPTTSTGTVTCNP